MLNRINGYDVYTTVFESRFKFLVCILALFNRLRKNKYKITYK